MLLAEIMIYIPSAILAPTSSDVYSVYSKSCDDVNGNVVCMRAVLVVAHIVRNYPGMSRRRCRAAINIDAASRRRRLRSRIIIDTNRCCC